MASILTHRLQSKVRIDLRVTLPDGLWEHLPRHQVCSVWVDPEAFLTSNKASEDVEYMLGELQRKATIVKERTT